MTSNIRAEVRSISVHEEREKAEVNFVFTSPTNGWRPQPGFDVLEDERLDRFMHNYNVSSLEDLPSLAPPEELGVGQTPADNPTWVKIVSGGNGPDYYSIDVQGYEE